MDADPGKSSGDLLAELETLRRRVAVLERQAEHQQLETKSEMHRAMLDVLLEVDPSLILFKDVNSVIGACSRAMCELVGRPRDEIIGKTDRELFPREEAARFRQEEIQVMETGEPLMVEHFVNGAGGPRWYKGNKYPLRDAAGDIMGVLCAERDMTDHKEVEAERDEQWGMLQTLLDNTPDIVIFKDLQSKFLACSRSIAQLFSGTPEEMIGKTDFEFFPPEIAQGYLEEERRVLETGEPVIAEHLIGDRWYEAIKTLLRNRSGEIVGLFSSEREVTDRKRAEEARRESEERYRSLFDCMSEGAVLKEMVYDSSGQAVDYMLVDANPAFEQLTGLRRADVLGKRMSAIMGISEPPPYVGVYARVVERRQPAEFDIDHPTARSHLPGESVSHEWGAVRCGVRRYHESAAS